MNQLNRKSLQHHRCWCIATILIGLFVLVQSAPQFLPSASLDTFEVKKSANTSYSYQSLNGLQHGYNYAYGDSFVQGYKSKDVPNHTATPVIIHAPNNRSFVKFGTRRPDDELVFLESKHSQLNDQNKQVIVFETTAPDHKFSHVELFTNDPNFHLNTEFKDNYLLARFTYTGPDRATQKHATINVYGYHNDRLPGGCFLYYYNCEIKQ